FVTSALTEWLERGLHVGIISLEMSMAEVGMRWLSAMSDVDMMRVRRRALYERDWPALAQAGERAYYYGRHLHITDTPYMTLPRIRAMARTCAAQHGLDLLVVDYLQLLESDGSGRRDESRQEAVSKMSRGMKLLARE